MSVQISKDVINKLTHSSDEIRLRALGHIEPRFVRAVAHQLSLVFEPTELCKQLIRWFKHPLSSNSNVQVLQLLARVLESSYGKEALENLGVDRLKKELSKVRKMLFGDSQELEVIHKIDEILFDYETRSSDLQSNSDIVNFVEKLSITSSDDMTELPHCVPGDFELPWSKQSVDDHNSLKVISSVLTSVGSTLEEKDNYLQYLQIVMPDFPAEYMLQPPHLFVKLLQLCGKPENHGKLIEGRIFATIYSFLKTLKQCLCKQRRVESYAARNVKSSNDYQHQTDSSVKTQLKVSKALTLLLEKCLEHLEIQLTDARKDVILVMELAREVIDIVKALRIYIDDKFFTKINHIKTKLLNICNHDQCNIILGRIKYIWMAFMLLEMTEINYQCSQLRDQCTMLVPELVDFSLQLNFPVFSDRVKKLIFSTDVNMEHSYNEIQKLNSHFETGILFLMQKEIDSSYVITQAEKLELCLNILKSFKLTKIVFDAILNAVPLYLTKSDMKLQATSLMHKLLQLKSPNLKSYIYQRVAVAVKKSFASLMSNDSIRTNNQNQQLLSALIIGVPFDFNVIQQIIHDSFENNCPELRRNAENILLLLLRSHHFYESTCRPFTKIYSPLLPLLQCCTHSKHVYDMLLKLLDPDLKLFQFIDLLRGNIGLMFSNDSGVRSEALTRLIYVINSLPQTTDYVPNIIEVSDVLPNDLCVQQTPRDFRQIFVINESYYELKTLENLLTLLDTTDVEPQVRKSALMQLNIMCRNWETVAEFCKQQAYCLVLSVLENSLKKDSTTDYIESVIPTVGILVKLLLYDCGFRDELANIPNVYVLLLRALFHFSQDVQLRQDTSVCLFLLVFGNFLDFCRPHEVVAPKLMNNLKIPFKCTFKPMTESMQQSDFSNFPDISRKLFTKEGEWKSYLRQVVAYSYFKRPYFLKKEVEQMHTVLDICPSLLLEKHDAHLFKATNCFENMKTILKAISDASNQAALIESITTLRLTLMLHQQECNTLTQLPTQLSNGIYLVLSKYLQVTPGNAADFEVYESVLDILYLCIRLSSISITRQLKNALYTDKHHGIMLMIKNPEIPLNMYLHLSEFIIALLSSAEGTISNAEQNFQNNLFNTVYDLMQTFYIKRNIQQIRCLLPLLKELTANRLDVSQEFMHKCSKSFIKLSIHIRSSTQVGSQLQRDILLNFIQVFEQLSEPIKVTISDNFLKHLIGLGGHHDMEVRALAWICLSLIADSGHQNINGTQIIENKLSFLPGGFINCCLETFLDKTEAVLVRNFAGNLFVRLLKETCTFKKALSIIEKKMFFAIAYSSLETCIFDGVFPLQNAFFETSYERKHDDNIELATCETVICYCRICIALIELQPEFVIELCEKPLLFKLYELFKLPTTPSNVTHYEMCSQICHLYALCSKDNFIFLQQTLCHDDRWLSCLFDLLVPPLHVTEDSIVCVLQLILALCVEEFVFHRLCNRLTKNVEILRQLFNRVVTITHIKSTVMRCTLSMFTYLLIKSQTEGSADENELYFTTALDKEFKLIQEICESSSYHSVAEENKENDSWSSNFKSTLQRRKLETANFWNQIEVTGKACLSELIVLDLYKIFIHLYQCSTFKFDNFPSVTRIQICEALSLLLKLSPHARKAANNLKLLNSIILILENFLREFGNNGTTFIKRHGESKKLAIIKNLKILFQILLYWFSPAADILVDELQCLKVSKIILQGWSWIEHSLELKLLVLQVCSFLSERSLAICGQFSTLISSFPLSILQLVIKVVVSETYKIKTIHAMHLPIVTVGLRIMMNCCACTEGRFILVKERALDAIDGLFSVNMKLPKIRFELLVLWLEFWELFSRYNEGGQTRNLNTLCAVVNQSMPISRIRIICLKILRNMCFVHQNRSTLMTSSDFIYIANHVIAQPISNDETHIDSFEEQLIVSVAIWQLISGGVKFMAMLRGTKLAKKLQVLHEKLLVLNDEKAPLFTKTPFAVDLANVLEIIINIFTEN